MKKSITLLLLAFFICSNLAFAGEKSILSGTEIIAEYYAASCQLRYTANLQIGIRSRVNDTFSAFAGYSLAMNDISNNIATIGGRADI